MHRIKVGISECLLGEPVRHDGGHKRSRYCQDTLQTYFHFQPFCPEMGAGLGVPRPTIHLRRAKEGEIRLVESRSGVDRTDNMQDWIGKALPAMAELRGFILTAKSPSCGMERIRVYKEDGEALNRDGVGMFAQALMDAYPLLPVEEEGRLHDHTLRENFLERVFFYDDWCRSMGTEAKAQALVQFHSRHKFQILAHCQVTYRELGPLLANLRGVDITQVADEYFSKAMAAMKKRTSRGAHVNSLQHLFGFFSDQIQAEERRFIQDSLNAYANEQVPLIVPMSLLRQLQSRFPHDYIGKQEYLSPYPDQLGLRNNV